MGWTDGVIGMLERAREPSRPLGVAPGLGEPVAPSCRRGVSETRRRNWSLFMAVENAGCEGVVEVLVGGSGAADPDDVTCGVR